MTQPPAYKRPPRGATDVMRKAARPRTDARLIRSTEVHCACGTLAAG